MKPTWEREGIQLFHGDALAVLPSIDCEQVDAVIADPPYGIDYQSAWRTDRTQWKPKIANDGRPFVWWLFPAYRVAKPSSCLLCFCRWDVQQAFQDAMEWSGWDVRSQIIWDREAHGMGDLNGCPAPQHDVLWFGVKGNYKFHGNRPKSVVRSMRLGGLELTHPNEKPLDLLRQLIVDYVPEGGTVLDCFLGSGTTAVACIQTGRKFIGCEIDDTHYRDAEQRIKDELDRAPLFTEPAQVQTGLFEARP